MKTLLCLICLFLAGCGSTAVEKLRLKIPAGHADTLNATVTTLGGWGGSITGKNIDSTGGGHISADEYSETVNTPWASYHLNLTVSSIGEPAGVVYGPKMKLKTKPAKETAAPVTETKTP